MIRLQINILFGLILLLISSPLFANRKILTPYLHNKKVQVKSGGKKSARYYQLSKKFGTMLKANGPGKVTVYIRVPIKEGEIKTTPFSLKYTIDGKKIRVRKIKAIQVSKKANIEGEKGGLSIVRKVNFIIPPGKHKLDFIALNTKQKVFSKFYFTKYPSPKWKNKPLTKKSSEVLLTTLKNKQLKYQRIDAKKGIKFKADGKSYLRFLIRGEFKSHMFADNTLRVQIKENGKIINTIHISSKRSKSVVYTKGGRLVPGTPNKFFMEVPKGSHEYEIVVVDKRKSALVKISFDKKRFPLKKKKRKVNNKKNHD